MHHETLKDECVQGLFETSLDMLNFDRYSEWFREDSRMIVAEAGVFKGVDAIEEYARFVSKNSPYMRSKASVRNLADMEIFVKIENGVCTYLQAFEEEYVTEPSTSRPTRFRSVAMVKVYYDVKNKYFPQANLYYTKRTLNHFFGEVLESTETRRYVCSVMKDVCGYQYDNQESCEEKLNRLPVLQGKSHLDGNSQACRVLYAAFAETNPEQHCPHLSFDPMPDKRGAYKCQGQGGRLEPSNLFTREDFNFYRDFARLRGFDTLDGYIDVPLGMW
eukprot:CAMPEP_0118683802 /NCGR_PEP_ID=MMETSP0800-20121206/6260_1 /TAXON_ID=210618 ORGANISM="Striatella unipunctata, Strain CCMP2910" /NCGR_SAMPLE_ID=MMETSP0800 /ASSEMBLY_ACC=CAM_ASM_000638 /LENGTH=274 /DNA_ID=CAMNT_0006580377 /DNA_START=135 /DNA_END=956 /DNA_ORIENTATION=+